MVDEDDGIAGVGMVAGRVPYPPPKRTPTDISIFRRTLCSRSPAPSSLSSSTAFSLGTTDSGIPSQTTPFLRATFYFSEPGKFFQISRFPVFLSLFFPPSFEKLFFDEDEMLKRRE